MTVTPRLQICCSRQKNSARLKEAAISLQEWAKILNTDRSHASSILAGLVEKRVFIRHFFGPGKGYIYTTNTAVTEWGNGCIKRQQLLEITTQPLPESATVGLPKTATPSDTNLVSRKERLKKIKEITKDINIDTKYKSSKYGHMVCQTSEDIAWVKAIRKERKKALGFDKKERTTDG